MYCVKCGKEVPAGTKFCPSCGASQDGVDAVSEKSRLAALLLAIFLGSIGVHRFYVGKVGTGIAIILLTCCFGAGTIWALIDIILIACGVFKDSNGKVISDWKVD